MGNINLSRVVLGGLVAGVVATILSYLFQLAMQEQMSAALTRLGLSEPSGGATAIMIALGFVASIVLIWFYAAVRPRLGAGVRTAVIVAVALWIVVSLVPVISFTLLGILGGSLVVVGPLFDLVSIVLAAIAGAWVYRVAAPGR
jgi:hypothetical protein